MSTIIIVDSACELPAAYAHSKAIKVLPINITLGDRELTDPNDSKQLLQWIDAGKLSAKHYANSDAATPEQIKQFLIDEILPHYDTAIVQTVSRSRSNQFDYWAEVNQRFASQFRRYRGEGQKAFTLSLIDSGTGFSGQSLLTLETLRQAKKMGSRRALLDYLKKFTNLIQAYTAPADLGYLRKRAKQRGDSSIGLVDTLVGKALSISPILFGMRNELGLSDSEKGHDKAVARMFNHAKAVIDKGVASPIITVSYTGPLQELEQRDSYQDFCEYAQAHKCKVFASVASLSSTISLGPGNLGLAIAGNDPDFVISKKSK